MGLTHSPIGSEKFVENFYGFLKDGDIEELANLFEDSASMSFPGVSNPSGIYLGSSKIKKFFKKILSFVPDLNFEVVRVICGGNTICVEWSFSGNTRRGKLLIKNGVSVFELSGSYISSMNNYVASGLFI